jgi:hypothetical protein
MKARIQAHRVHKMRKGARIREEERARRKCRNKGKKIKEWWPSWRAEDPEQK